MAQWLAKRKIKRENKTKSTEDRRITEENRQMAAEDTQLVDPGRREPEEAIDEVLMSTNSSQDAILALTSRLRANLLSKQQRHQYERAANREAISNPTWRLEESTSRSAFDAMASGRSQDPVLKYMGNDMHTGHRNTARVLPGMEDDSEVSDYDSDEYQSHSRGEDNLDEETPSHEDSTRQPITLRNPVRLRSCLRTASTDLAVAGRPRVVTFALTAHTARVADSPLTTPSSSKPVRDVTPPTRTSGWPQAQLGPVCSEFDDPSKPSKKSKAARTREHQWEKGRSGRQAWRQPGMPGRASSHRAREH